MIPPLPVPQANTIHATDRLHAFLAKAKYMAEAVVEMSLSSPSGNGPNTQR